MEGYRHLTQRQRFIIQDLWDLGKTKTEIAKNIGVHRSTVSRELKRNSNQKGGYKALGAHLCSQGRRTSIYDFRRKIDGPLMEAIIEKLLLGWSPEQISGRLKLESSFSISHESIYRWIYKVAPEFKSCLRVRSKRRRGLKKRRRGLTGLRRRSIEDRPKAADKRSEIGHWERDLMEGKRSGPSFLVIVDRKTRYTKIERVFSHSSEEINQATNKLLESEPRRTITNDNGVEFGNFKDLEKKLRVPVYYTKPYTSWQRGTVENTIGLVRQFFPKAKDLWQVTNDEARMMESNLNFRPRKKLGFRTPFEEYFSENQKLIMSESTYRKRRSKRLFREELEFFEEFYKDELRALKC